MLYYIKEILTKSGWCLWGTGRTSNKDITLAIQRHSVLLVHDARKKYSEQTLLEIRFNEPNDFIRTSRVDDLIKIRENTGHSTFDTVLGYWPWDDITALRDTDLSKELKSQYGIMDARLISWRT